jgi:hypothetical protein
VLLGLTVERVLVGARGVLMKERAADLVLVLPAVVLQIVSMLLLLAVVVIRGTYAGVRLAVGLVVVGHLVQLSGAGTRNGGYQGVKVVVLVMMLGDGIAKEKSSWG